jgi:hypothetical protein
MPYLLISYVSHTSLVWSGRIPETEKVTFIDNAEGQHIVVRTLISIVDKQERARPRLSTSALKGYEFEAIRFRGYK